MAKIKIAYFCLLAAGISPWLASCKKSFDQNATNEPIKPLPEYTLSEPREWSAIAKQHSPVGRKSFGEGKNSVLVEVPLATANISHYIEKIGIMDLKGKELAVKTIERASNPITHAHFDLKLLPWTGRVKLFAKCNLHDLWVHEVDVTDIGM